MVNLVPILARKPNAPRSLVVGYAIEDIGVVTYILGRLQARKVNNSHHLATCRVYAYNVFCEIDISPNLTLYPFEFVEVFDLPAPECYIECAESLEGLGIAQGYGVCAIAHIEHLAIGCEPPTLAFVVKLAHLAQRLAVIDKSLPFAPSELVDLLAQERYALAKVGARECHLLLGSTSRCGLVGFQHRGAVASRTLPKYTIGVLEALRVVRSGVGKFGDGAKRIVFQRCRCCRVVGCGAFLSSSATPASHSHNGKK